MDVDERPLSLLLSRYRIKPCTVTQTCVPGAYGKCEGCGCTLIDRTYAQLHRCDPFARPGDREAVSERTIGF